MSAVAAAVRDAVGASSKALGLPPFKQLLSAEPSFIVDDTPGPEASIDINEGRAPFLLITFLLPHNCFCICFTLIALHDMCHL